MLDGFIEYERSLRDQPDTHKIVGVPVGTRLQRIIRGDNGWMLWVSTRDFMYGTYYVLQNDGTMISVTSRQDEGDERFVVRPSDDTIRQRR